MGAPRRASSKGFSTPANQSAGILDDHAVRKNIATQESNIAEINKKKDDAGNYPDLTIYGNTTINSDLTVDSPTLVVDSTNHRIGIGTATPLYDVHLQAKDLWLRDETVTGPKLVIYPSAHGRYGVYDFDSISLHSINSDGTGAALRFSYDATLRFAEIQGYFGCSLTALSDKNEGDMFSIHANENIELTDTDAHQNWLNVKGHINQTGTASYRGLNMQIHEHSLGAGPNYLTAIGDDTTAFRFCIATGGNVGIGTATPDTKLQVVGDCKFGDDNTNYVEFSTTGDQVFVGSSGLCFAEIYAADVATEITIAGTGKANKVQITAFAVDGASNNATPDHTNDHITIVKAGMYMCNVSMHVKTPAGGSSHVVGYSVWKNNGAVGGEFANLHGQRQLASGGTDEGSISLSGIIDLAASDTIEVWVWDLTGTDNIVIDDINLSLFQIGGT